VIVDITRGGPGLGNIAPEQGDYRQVVKVGGHGCYRVLVLAPNSVQEMADLTTLAFDLADEYRTPVFVMADGFIGQMMEPVRFSSTPHVAKTPDWAVDGTQEKRKNLIASIRIEADALEQHVLSLDAKYKRAEREAVKFEAFRTDDADAVLVAYGIVSRICKSVVEQMRAEGIKVGLLRPITLYPFPEAKLRQLARTASVFGCVEASTGQMVEDVRLAIEGRKPVEFYGRCGGNLPSEEEVTKFVREIAGRSTPVMVAEEAIHG
jgi:pyruvate/2-oxoacid:ferredoxin oxidoreductase alpha subunit